MRSFSDKISPRPSSPQTAVPALSKYRFPIGDSKCSVCGVGGWLVWAHYHDCSRGVAEPAKFVPWRTVIAPCLQLLLISRFTLRPSGHETRTPDDELVVDPRSGME